MGCASLVLASLAAPAAPAASLPGCTVPPPEARDGAAAKARSPRSCPHTPTGLDSVPPLPQPPLDRAVREPSSGLRLTRITDKEARGIDDPYALRHHYSKRQAWNRDETLLDLGSRIVDTRTYREVLPKDPLSSARDWSARDPDLLIGIRYHPEPNELATFDVRTRRYGSLHRFEGYERCTFGQGEGNVAADDTRVVLSCDVAKGTETHLISFDLERRRVIATLVAAPNFNWASFSPSGEHIVVENNHWPDPDAQLLRYSPDFGEKSVLSESPEHGDFALNADGDEVYAMIDGRDIRYVRLADALTVSLGTDGRLDALGSGHLSCRSVRRPDWCYYSTLKGGLLGAVRLGSPAPPSLRSGITGARAATGVVVEHWGYHRSSGDDYAAQAKASVSPSGRSIVFTSDWDGEHAPEEYVLEADEVTPDEELR